MADPQSSTSEQILTADGIPLKVSLQRSMRRRKLRAAGLVLPPLAFLLILFVFPIGSLLTMSVDDTLVNQVFPRTFENFDQWDQEGLPGEELYAAVYEDLTTANRLQVGRASIRMNYVESGWRSLVKVSARKFRDIEGPPYKAAMIEADERWGEMTYWESLGAMKDPYTLGYYLNALDYQYDGKKNIVPQPENRQVYQLLWWRTLEISVLVTLGCLLLGYPVAHLLATLPLRYSNLLMICVLMPFWTSLLVRIVAWMIMLQQNGVVNDTLVWAGLLGDDNRLRMMYNFNGTVIVMIQILLPFMILPLYSVMKTIPPSYMKAAQNLGATPSRAFFKVYLPQTVPGIGAGVILVFIVAIGYYITPELVGGRNGQMIGNFIARHMQQTLNWGLAAAMGTLLLFAILLLYYVYDRIVGIDNMKMG